MWLTKVDEMSGIAMDQVVPPPSDQLPRSHAELIVTLIVGAVWLCCLAWALRSAVKDRNPLAVLLLFGGAITVLQEPIVDVLGYVWVRSNLTVFATFGREMPLWAVLAYSIFWGFQPYVLSALADRGLSRRTFRFLILACFGVNLMIEWPILATGIYTYYGDQPFDILGFPLHWLFVNSVGVVAIATVVARYRWFLTGWRMVWMVLVPVVVTPAMSLAAGLPVFSALQSGTDSLLVNSACALLTAGIATLIIEQCARVLCAAAPPTNFTPLTSEPERFIRPQGYTWTHLDQSGAR